MNIGILTSGGPAPGFNGVIESVVKSAYRRGWTVTAIPNGYSKLIAGDTNACYPLTPALVAGQETRGGSMIGTNRANPRKSQDAMDAVVKTVASLGLDALVTIGGDDTATAAMSVGEALQAAGKSFRVAHVPKTIDNDLPLPGEAPTFGFETAKHVGAELCRNLRVDAITTGRWYIATAMGRSAGHLALGIATASGADLCVIREEFGDDVISLASLTMLVEDAIKIRTDECVNGGLVVLGEGLLERLDPDELAAIADLELDEHGNPRMSEVDLGKAVADAVKARGGDTAFVTKLIGYELRCADPIGFDVQYTRALGHAAVAFLADGEGDGLICLRENKRVILRFDELRDENDRVPVRRVDLSGANWQSSLALQARK